MSRNEKNCLPCPVIFLLMAMFIAGLPQAVHTTGIFKPQVPPACLRKVWWGKGTGSLSLLFPFQKLIVDIILPSWEADAFQLVWEIRVWGCGF